MNTRIKTRLTVISLILFTSCATDDEVDFKKYYDEYDLRGGFVVYNIEADKYIVYNTSLTDSGFTPASTFKICNSLIGIETQVVSDQYVVLPWDSVEYQNPNWNKDTDLKTAFKNSTVWYYQELATRVGDSAMKLWLEELEYGNADISGGITQFWLDGGLRISPMQQVVFLTKLVKNELPLQQFTMDAVKDIMIYDKTGEYTIRGKTGWGFQEGKDIGWFVGFLETNGKTYVFANCVQAENPDSNKFAAARIDIVYQILMDLQLIKKQAVE